MSPLSEALAGRPPPPAMEVGGAGKQGEFAFKINEGLARPMTRGVLTARPYVAEDVCETVMAEPITVWGKNSRL